MRIQGAIVSERGGDFLIDSMELDEPRDDEILVKIVASGICHTDLAVCEQHIPLPLPAVLGHEGAGVVVRTGANVSGVVAGDHVVLSFASCGRCSNCECGRPAYCAEFVAYNAGARRPDGSCTHRWLGKPITSSFFYQSSFATHAIAHRRNVVKVPKDLPLPLLAPLGCGVQTGAGTVLNVLAPSVNASMAIFGMGAVGLSAVMAAKIAQCSVIVAIDIHDDRLALAREFGATHVVNAREQDPVSAIRDVCAKGVDFTIEAVGVPAIMQQAVESLAYCGTAVLLGVAPAGERVSFDASTLLSGRVIRSSIEGNSVPEKFIPELIEFYRRGQFPFDKMISYYEFDRINQAISASKRGEAIKPVLTMPA